MSRVPALAWGRAVWGPPAVTTGICAVAAAGIATQGWVLTWLALGLSAGYALSGSV